MFIYAELGQVYTGIATPIIITTIHYGFNDPFREFITYTARADQIIYGPTYTYNSDGEVIKPGMLLIKMKTDYQKNILENLKAKVQQDIDTLKLAKIKYKRYKTLSVDKAVSKEHFENWQNQYQVTLNKLNGDKAFVLKQQAVYDMCWLRAEYDGIVDEVFFFIWITCWRASCYEIITLTPWELM